MDTAVAHLFVAILDSSNEGVLPGKPIDNSDALTQGLGKRCLFQAAKSRIFIEKVNNPMKAPPEFFVGQMPKDSIVDVRHDPGARS
jgi:hypothetical protein